MVDLFALLGTIIGISAVVGGQWLEGGSIGQITQLTAGLIVIGGTCGAVLLSFPFHEIRHALKLFPQIYWSSDRDSRPLIDEIIGIATLARKEGVLAIETQKQSIRDPMFRRCLQFVIDGFEPATVREILEAEIDASHQRDEAAARVFEAAGGYSPTIGILGAVLGLIHVLSMLNDPSKIGEGIAVAFVATVYGVAFANLLLLPWGTRLRRLAEKRARFQELVMQGVLGIQEGLNPHFLREKLQVLLDESPRKT
jgi:chemotaxis protein MotA